MFGLIKKMFISAMICFGFNVFNVSSLECVSMNYQGCKIRSEIINVNTYSIKINSCKGSCNTINDRYANICVPNNIKHTNVKLFDLMS